MQRKATTKSGWILGATMTAAVFTCAGCSVGIPLDANMRIDTSEAGYSQRGSMLDRSDMVDELEAEPENRERIESAKSMKTGSTLFSALSGASDARVADAVQAILRERPRRSS